VTDDTVSKFAEAIVSFGVYGIFSLSEYKEGS
jgi:hypothetical protein